MITDGRRPCPDSATCRDTSVALFFASLCVSICNRRVMRPINITEGCKEGLVRKHI